MYGISGVMDRTGRVRWSSHQQVVQDDSGMVTVAATGELIGDEVSLAEALLERYQQDPTDFIVSDLDGGFAFAISDRARGRALLGVDRFATFPMYWATTASGDLAFGSTVADVLRHGGVARELDHQAVRELLIHQRVLGKRTLIAAVSRLPGGSILRHDGSGPNHEHWFRMEYEPASGRDRSSWSEELADVYRRSVRRAGGDDGAGILLSGGLDARMVVAAAASPLRAFHFNEGENREYRVAEMVAAAGGCDFISVERPANFYASIFSHAVEAGSGEFGFLHAHPLGLVAGSAGDVMLHGFAPELFFRGTNLPHSYRSIRGRPYRTMLDPSITGANAASWFVTGHKYSLASTRPDRWLRESASDYYAAIDQSADELVAEARFASDDPYDWCIWADTRYHTRYPSFLFELAVRQTHRDRSVVLQNEVLDLHLRMPVSMRADNRTWLAALALLDPKIAKIPDANTGRSPNMPEPLTVGLRIARSAVAAALRRPKPDTAAQGSWPNFARQMTSGALRQPLAELFRNPAALDPQIFDVAAVTAALDDVANQPKLVEPLQVLATIAEWHRMYGPPGEAL